MRPELYTHEVLGIRPPEYGFRQRFEADWSNELSRGSMIIAIGGWKFPGGSVSTVVHDKGLLAARKMNRAVERLSEYIDIDPARRAGIPVIKGTRFRVSQLFAQLADGDSISDLEENLELDRALLQNLLHALSVVIDQPAANEHNPA